MVIAVYVLIILASVTQSATTKLFNKYSSHASVFNAIKSCTALILFALIAAFGFTVHLPTVLFGFSYGACLCISMYAGFSASFAEQVISETENRDFGKWFLVTIGSLCDA